MEITPERLRSVLENGGIEVRTVHVVFSKELPVSTVHRLSIEYKDKANDADRPASLFLKLGRPIKNEPVDICRPEVEFYKEPAAGIGCPPLIRCYDAAFDEGTGRSHILLEDLTETHSQPEQNTAPSAEMSRLAVEALAKVHARWWNSPKLGNGIGKVFDDAWRREFVRNLNKNVTEFSEIAGLTKEQKDAYRLMLKAAQQIWGRLTEPSGLTATHGDLHWWNFLYPKDPERDSVRLFDWQLWHIDLGARDLAFLLALGGFAEPRPQIEEKLLRAYHEALDIEDYSWEMLNKDYRLSAIRNLNIPLVFWKQGKHETTWRTALRRAYDAYERLGCSDLIRQSRVDHR